MQNPDVSRRTLIAALIAASVAPSAKAQVGSDGFAWGQATAAIWIEIMQVPMALLRTSGLSAYRVADDERELNDARARAATKRATMESEIARCRAMMEATPPAPQMAAGWEQTLIDQTLSDQGIALDRLAALAVFLESNSNAYVNGNIPFAAAMRMSNWSLFGETDWIMASSTKLARVGEEPNGFVDLWHRSASLDWLASSVVRGVAVRIVHGDPPSHVTEAQVVLAAIASEMREISGLYSTADQRPLRVAGEARLRIRRALPRLAELAANQAQALDDAARAWPSLSPTDVIADDAAFDQAPSFMAVAGPLIGDLSLPT